MSAKFTPGIWEVDFTGSIEPAIIVNNGIGDPWSIAVCCLGMPGDERANAHLIAAAPLMYKSLQKISETIQDNLLDQYAAMCEIEELLAQARGER